MAQLYASGYGLPRNIAQAKVWYRAAADRGLTAAADRLKELEDAHPRTERTPAATSDRLVPAAPVEPAGGRTIVTRRGPPVAELVWVVPPQPKPVRFFIQVLAVKAEGWRELLAGYVTQSAALVQLDPATTRYAWRAYVVAEGDLHYAVGDWTQFAVKQKDDGTPGIQSA